MTRDIPSPTMQDHADYIASTVFVTGTKEFAELSQRIHRGLNSAYNKGSKVTGREETLQDLLDSAMKKFFTVRAIIKETLDTQPDTTDPMQHNRWLTNAMQEIERIMQ